jgi:hypothetical protein
MAGNHSDTTGFCVSATGCITVLREMCGAAAVTVVAVEVVGGEDEERRIRSPITPGG